MWKPSRPLMLIFTLVALVATACGGLGGGGQQGNNSQATPTTGPAANAIQISIIYAPESDLYMQDAMAKFNAAYASGKNPVTGAALGANEKPIYITGKSGSSGTVMQGIINAIIAPNNANVERPTIFEPSVSHWLALANLATRPDLFDLANSPATAQAAVVMAIWESRLKAIQAKNPGKDIGWQQILDVLNDPKGWEDYGFTGRRTVYYGHTDPYISSTALSTLVAEFYASARKNGFTGRRLTMDVVNPDTDLGKKVQDGVKDIESLIRHYSSRTTEFKEYIAQGPDYLDFVALEENDLIFINQGKTQYKPPEKLVALYPAEGTFWHEHPFAIPNADWVSAEQRDAAKVFTQYILSEDIQREIMADGFRPVNPKVALGYPITTDLGVDPNQPKTILEVPDAPVLDAIQKSWSFVKKQADVWMVIDISGSMNDEENGVSKIEQAKKAALAFLDKMESQNRVGLVVFSSDINVLVPMDTVETNKAKVRDAINGLIANGNTLLYQALIETLKNYKTGDTTNRIRAIVVMTDGQDSGMDAGSKLTLNDVTRQIASSREDLNPVIVIPVAYGKDADTGALNSIARASSTKVQSGDPSNISSVLQIISSYF